ncbi:polypeptide N-acetylgalactosaminyltransferase 11-like [Ornithodoros turicata]|uniref:polypeptide N-acetylgalactosaminyltransferase 11-like n=1 Tax=Ornithodoros turicata TaxID=34597 RepID=UPI0031389FCA
MFASLFPRRPCRRQQIRWMLKTLIALIIALTLFTLWQTASSRPRRRVRRTNQQRKPVELPTSEPPREVLLGDDTLRTIQPYNRSRTFAFVDAADPEEEEFFAQMNPKWGDYGDPTNLEGAEKEESDKQFGKAGFNVYLCDRIPLNRTLGDRRHKQCQTLKYPMDMPSVSVIICFYNEIFSALLRTLYSVTARSPPWLLQEIILIDDFSDTDDLKTRLYRYLRRHYRPGFVKLYRLSRREGLIRARIEGVKRASGDIILFMDSHCEATYGWLEPLVKVIHDDPTTVASPVIAIIDENTFTYQGDGLHFLQIGTFEWNGDFTWQHPPFGWRPRDLTAPVKSPTMAGGLFAMDRRYFWDLGGYDAGMNGWGGENIELSFRTWMCGGRVVVVPCSQVGHIFRINRPYTIPGESDSHGRNTRRLAEVWMDEYKELLFKERPHLRDMEFGDVSERKALREKLQCHSFHWYLENIHPGAIPDLPKTNGHASTEAKPVKEGGL